MKVEDSGNFKRLIVRPVHRDEIFRFNEVLDEYHWLGHRLVGEVMRYVALEDERVVRVVGFGSGALSLAAGDPTSAGNLTSSFAGCAM